MWERMIFPLSHVHISTFSGDKLRYPVKRTPGDVIKATLFGKSSVRNAMSIYAYGSNALTERMTKDYKLDNRKRVYYTKTVYWKLRGWEAVPGQ